MTEIGAVDWVALAIFQFWLTLAGSGGFSFFIHSGIA